MFSGLASAVTTTGPKDAWAFYYSQLTKTEKAWHWNGKPPSGVLTGPVTGDGHGGLWLTARSTGGKPFFAHYLSGKWSTAPQPSDPLGQITVTGLSLIPGSQSVLAVGSTMAGTGSNGAANFKYGT